ncbi:MAG TPA: translation initiation factor IF-2 [Candidatus Nanoarchaeia archaeon]|nr:translation initiation factor IF-2 [Candidatus Nanoarchaeia archaeon]
MPIRRPIITVLGHVDHGKSSILDKIRGTAVVSREAGGITQAIGCSIVPLSTVEKICGQLLSAIKSSLTIPGLLFIDSPGHAAFTSLRKRGGSLADIAILVVDINEGFKPQTIESLEILKANRVPFVVAANKIDLIPGWQYDDKQFLLPNLNALEYKIQGEFEKRLYALVAQFQEHSMPAERFDRIQDYTKQAAIIPVSAKTGQGIPELLMVLTGLAQKYLEQQLKIEVQGTAKGTILEIKEEKGLGTTIDAIIYDGHLRVNDMLIIGGIAAPLAVKIRALLEPRELVEMREKKSAFRNVKEVFAATGVKIAAPGLETAMAGMPLRSSAGKAEEIEQFKKEVQEEISEVLLEESGEEGVLIKADTLGGLEALQKLLRDKKIPISSASLGSVTKKDLSKLETLKEKNEQQGVLLGFNITMNPEIEALAKAKKLKIILHDVIYQLIDDYDAFTASLKKEIELRELASLVRPCKFILLKGYVFRQNNPAIAGIEIEVGSLKTGDPIMNRDGKKLSTAKSMKDGEENVTKAEQGKQVALAMDGVTIGRQVQEGDILYTDIPEADFQKLKELKLYLSKLELAVLKEIADIKRKENPVWGV